MHQVHTLKKCISSEGFQYISDKYAYVPGTCQVDTMYINMYQVSIQQVGTWYMCTKKVSGMYQESSGDRAGTYQAVLCITTKNM